MDGSKVYNVHTDDGFVVSIRADTFEHFFNPPFPTTVFWIFDNEGSRHEVAWIPTNYIRVITDAVYEVDL